MAYTNPFYLPSLQIDDLRIQERSQKVTKYGNPKLTNFREIFWNHCKVLLSTVLKVFFFFKMLFLFNTE